MNKKTNSLKRNKMDMPGYLVNLIDHAFQIRRNEALSQFGVTSSQSRVIRCLWGNDGLYQSDIAKELEVKAPSLTRLVEQLEKKGFIERNSCSEDARAKRVYLTDEGRDIRVRSVESIHYLEDLLFTGFDQDEKSETIVYLTRMLFNIKGGEHND